jgi:hypothetical protein
MKHSDDSLALAQAAPLLMPAYSTRLSWRVSGLISSSNSRLMSSTVKVRVPELRRIEPAKQSTSLSVRQSCCMNTMLSDVPLKTASATALLDMLYRPFAQMCRPCGVGVLHLKQRALHAFGQTVGVPGEE